MTENTENEFVFHANNAHFLPEFGNPPGITREPGGPRCLYFDDLAGEQWVVTVDPQTGRGEVRSGDCGWNVKFDLIDGGVEGLLIGHREARIIENFWALVTGKPVTSPMLVMANLADCETHDPTRPPDKSLEEVIAYAKACGKKTVMIHTASALGETHAECMASLKRIGDAGLSLRLMDVGGATAAIKAQLIDWDDDGSGDGGPEDDELDDDEPIYPTPSLN